MRGEPESTGRPILNGEDLVKFIKSQRWSSHVVRMDESMMPKMVMVAKIFGGDQERDG